MICFLEFFHTCFIFLHYLTSQVIYSIFPDFQSFSVMIVLDFTRLPGDLWKMFMEGKSFEQYAQKMVHDEKSCFEYTMPLNLEFEACMKTKFLTCKRVYLLNAFI